MYKVGDKLYTEDKSYYHFRPVFRLYEVVRVTPKGKIRLDNGSLISPENTQYKPYTEEVARYIKMWDLRQCFVDTIYTLGQASNSAFDKLTKEEIEELMPLLLNLLKMCEGNTHRNNYYTNEQLKSIPKKYKDIMEELENGLI